MLLARSPLATEQWNPLVQPVQFDHRHHVGDDGIDCRYCHSTVEVSSSAGYPSTSTCLNCHSQIWNKSPLLNPVRALYFEKRAVPWQKVHRLPDFVYFNHAIHVNKGIGCESCHGRLDRMAAVQRVQPLTMKWCLECHRNPTPHLRPRNAVTSMTWRPPSEEKPRQELAQALATELKLHTRVSCTTCHR